MLKKLALPLLAGLLLLAGCSNAVPQSDVESITEDELEALVGERPDVECPGDLEAEVGTEMTCVLQVESDPGEYEVYLTVTEVEDGDAYFEFEVSEQPVG